MMAKFTRQVKIPAVKGGLTKIHWKKSIFVAVFYSYSKGRRLFCKSNKEMI